MSGNMIGEDLDKALYDCMTTIWTAYRQSVKEHNYKPFNKCFEPLYEKYDDPSVVKFIAGMGMALVDAGNRRIKKDGD